MWTNLFILWTVREHRPLFFKWPLARYVWNTVSVAVGINCEAPDVQTCLTDWLDNFGKKSKKKVAVGVAAVLREVRKTRNLACFEKKMVL